MLQVGIIGFGVVGKSVANYVLSHTSQLQAILQTTEQISFCVWDMQPFAYQDLSQYCDAGIAFSWQEHESLADFIQRIHYAIPSPGVDMRPFAAMRGKFIEELDLVAALLHKPVVAITGSLGKTSLTKLTTQLLGMSVAFGQQQLAYKVVAGGNIGKAMLDLVAQQELFNCAVLELSSFQLERSNLFAPHIAVLNNVYENHLDRHGSLQEYTLAKTGIFLYQKPTDIAIVYEQCLYNEQVRAALDTSTARLIIAAQLPIEKILSLINKNAEVVTIENDNFVVLSIEQGVVVKRTVLAPCIATKLVDVTFIENWLVAVAIVYGMQRDVQALFTYVYAQHSFMLDEHWYRVEKFLSARGIDFYDDSKSTVIQATAAAVHKLALLQRPIILILGGKSKGVDRSMLMPLLADVGYLKKVYCFGSECLDFASCQIVATLEDIMHELLTSAEPGDIVLFSPSGASFDFFKNYQHRGDVFKELVRSAFKE